MGEFPRIRWIGSGASCRRSTATATAAAELRQVLTWGDDDESGATSRSSEWTTVSRWMTSRALRGSGRNSGRRSTAIAAPTLTWGRQCREKDREVGERKPLSVTARVWVGSGGGLTVRGKTGTVRGETTRSRCPVVAGWLGYTINYSVPRV